MVNQERPKFQVGSLGFIKGGQFEVKPLTIFCGPNNTGKTWAMYALYGCLDFLPSEMPLPELPDVAEALSKDGEFSWDLTAWVEKNHKRIIALVHAGCRLRLGRVFNTDDGAFESARFDWELSKQDLLDVVTSKKLDFRLEVGKQNDALRILKEAGSGVAQLTLLSEKLPDLKRHISDVIVRFMLGQDPTRNVFLIPAERNGLHLFFRELSSRRNALLHHAGRDEIDIKKLINDVLKSRYAEPIADYIDFLNELRTFRKEKSDVCHPRADALRKGLLGGKYEVNSEGLISFIPQKKRGEPQVPKMPLHLASSTVKSLFGLWFFLEHAASPGDILMIDEPELNLHPGAQRRIARLLAAIANQGITVVVSTHSDYFVREVNSLIMLSQEHPNRSALMKKYGYSEDEILTVDSVGAYIFDDGRVSPMEITAQEGVMADTFDKVIHNINETSDSIYYEYLENAGSED